MIQEEFDPKREVGKDTCVQIYKQVPTVINLWMNLIKVHEKHCARG